MRTLAERNEMVSLLEGQKEKAPHFNFFGEDNHAQLDAQIQVIEEEMDTDQVDDQWNPDEVYDQWNPDEVYDMNNSATMAANWLDGDDDAGDELRSQWG